MQRRNIYIALLAAIIIVSGCSKDFLDRSSLSQLAESNFWLNEKDAQLGINGVYEALQDRVLYSGSLNETAGVPTHDGMSDNCFNNYKFEGPGQFMEGNVDPAFGWFNTYWTSCYKGIARANTALEKIAAIPAADISDAKRKSFIAQAKFLRALFYFNLAVYYEDVPLIQKVQKLEESYVPKNSYTEIKDAIIKDLTEAIADLPNSYPATEFGYATKVQHWDCWQDLSCTTKTITQYSVPLNSWLRWDTAFQATTQRFSPRLVKEQTRSYSL